MAHIGTYLAPFGAHIAIGKFNKVKRILDIRIDRLHGNYFSRIELASHSAIKNWQWFGANVICQLKVFKETKTECLKIIRSRAVREFNIPSVHDQLPFFNGTNGIFPAIAV